MYKTKAKQFVQMYTTEVFMSIAVILGIISTLFHYITGPVLTFFFLGAGIILGIFFPKPVGSYVKKLYDFMAEQSKTTRLILNGISILLGIFVPFILFCFLGMLAGNAFHYYTRMSSNENSK